MPRVKIFLCSENYDSYDDPHRLIQTSITDWEEITEKELKYLIDHKWELLYNHYNHNMTPMIVVHDETVDVPGSMIKIKQILADLERKEAEKKAEAEKKKAERALKRAAKTKADELRLLEALKEKYKDEENSTPETS